MAQENQKGFKDGKSDEKSPKFIRHLYSCIRDYPDRLPCKLHDILRPSEIEWLLADTIKSRSKELKALVEFVISDGYKDVARLDEHGKPVLRRTTPIHHATRKSIEHVVPHLFTIYDSFDVNCVDEDGYSHFHVACRFGCTDAVRKFLAAGQDPNCVATKTGHSALHVALANDRREVARLLLLGGAEPNLRDKKKWTPLLLICRLRRDTGLAKMFLQTCKEIGRDVEIDARDSKGQTALQLAVASFSPDMTSLLLDNGAVLAELQFPTRELFLETLHYKAPDVYIATVLPAGLMTVIELLEKRGYQLDRFDAYSIMKLLHDLGLVQMPQRTDFGEPEICSCDDEEFVDVAKQVLIKPGLSLYDFIGLRAGRAARLVTYRDYYEFARSNKLSELAKAYREPCALFMCEVMCREFFLRWTRALLGIDYYKPPSDSLSDMFNTSRSAYLIYQSRGKVRPWWKTLRDVDEISGHRFSKACRLSNN